jgi:DNA primase
MSEFIVANTMAIHMIHMLHCIILYRPIRVSASHGIQLVVVLNQEWIRESMQQHTQSIATTVCMSCVTTSCILYH